MTHNIDAERGTSVFKQLLRDYMECLLNRDFKDAGAAREALIAEYVQAAHRAPAAAVPHGWKLVPAEVTKEIQDAWDSAPQDEDSDDEFYGAYRAMLAAAHQPPESASVQMPEPVCFALYDSQGFYETRDTEKQCIEFCNHYNARDARLGGGLAPYSYRPLYAEHDASALLASINHCPKT